MRCFGALMRPSAAVLVSATLLALVAVPAHETGSERTDGDGLSTLACSTMGDCAASPDCAQHCSGLPTVTTERFEPAGPLAVRPVKLDQTLPSPLASLEKPPPRFV
jgi:hypothetical protein